MADCPRPLSGLRVVRLSPADAGTPVVPCPLAADLPELEHLTLDLRWATADDFPWTWRVDWPAVLFPRWTRLERRGQAWWQIARMRWDRLRG